MRIPPHNERDKMAVILTLMDAYALHREELRKAISGYHTAQEWGVPTGFHAENWRNIARLVSRSRRAIIHAEDTYGFTHLRSVYHHRKPVPDPIDG